METTSFPMVVDLVELSRSMEKDSYPGAPLVLEAAAEVRRLSGLYEDAMLTLARVIAEREALDVELAKWRRA